MTGPPVEEFIVDGSHVSHCAASGFSLMMPDYDPMPNVGGLVVSVARNQWLDVAVDPSIYNFTASIGHGVFAFIVYDPEGGHFNGSVDVYLLTPKPVTAVLPVNYTAVTSWPVLRIASGGNVHVGQHVWVRFALTSQWCHHAISIIKGNQWPRVRRGWLCTHDGFTTDRMRCR